MGSLPANAPAMFSPARHSNQVKEPHLVQRAIPKSICPGIFFSGHVIAPTSIARLPPGQFSTLIFEADIAEAFYIESELSDSVWQFQFVPIEAEFVR